MCLRTESTNKPPFMKSEIETGIGVLTYQARHRKTYDTLCLLKSSGYQDVTVYALPYGYEKKFKPLYQHRPESSIDYPNLEEICDSFQYQLVLTDNIEAIPIEETKPLLLCGAGLLPQTFVQNHVIINAHPGYLPYSRGLDAFKWAIVENQPIGVTTHLLGEEVDAGEVIERRIISVYYEDTFHAVAQRVYETEIGMLVGSLKKLNEPHEYVRGGDNVIHRRMPHNIELRLMDAFDNIRKKSVWGGAFQHRNLTATKARLA